MEAVLRRTTTRRPRAGREPVSAVVRLVTEWGIEGGLVKDVTVRLNTEISAGPKCVSTNADVATDGMLDGLHLLIVRGAFHSFYRHALPVWWITYGLRAAPYGSTSYISVSHVLRVIRLPTSSAPAARALARRAMCVIQCRSKNVLRCARNW